MLFFIFVKYRFGRIRNLNRARGERRFLGFGDEVEAVSPFSSPFGSRRPNMRANRPLFS